MVPKDALVQLSSVLWEIPKSYRPDMRVPARVYATETMLAEIGRDRSLEQLINVTTLPGIVGWAMVMPDVHEGYGFPIGGVAATEYPDGAISPGGIGYDINCGVRLLISDMRSETLGREGDVFAKELYKAVPSGLGGEGFVQLNKKDLEEVLVGGARWVISQGYGNESDLTHIESSGTIGSVDTQAVSDRARQRGKNQLGTMGAGNHFIEIGRVDEIFDESSAKTLGLFKDQITILIHTGSRGLGHQVATDYIRIMTGAMETYGLTVPDRELSCVPFSAKEGKRYFSAMAGAANFAFANRQFIAWQVWKAWEKVLGVAGGKLRTLYDVAHNIAKVEDHEILGKKMKVIVHRKGATRAFAKGNPELANEYQPMGQPVLIPGSMGTASYVLLGTEGAMQQSFGSTCHGAGRRMSRHQATREVNPEWLRRDLEKEGIHIETRSLRGIAEEAPIAYKNVDEVVDVVHAAGIAKKVVKLRPLIVVKG